MKLLHALAGVSALTFVLAGPALAQQAADAQPAVASPAAAPAAAEAQPMRVVHGRALLTAEERASFRRAMREATPEQRQVLWTQMRADLVQRAAAQGATLAEPASMMGGREGMRGERGERGEGRRYAGESGRRMAPPREP